jgi:hypothetical protein
MRLAAQELGVVINLNCEVDDRYDNGNGTGDLGDAGTSLKPNTHNAPCQELIMRLSSADDDSAAKCEPPP